MSRRRIVYALAAIVLVAILLWGFRWKRQPSARIAETRVQKSEKAMPQDAAQSPTATQPRTTERGHMDEVFRKAYNDMFTAPISFYGKVVDEAGVPIGGASIKLMAADKPWEKSSGYETTSDGQGLFSLTGAKGAALSVDVRKDGFYSLAGSKGRFVFGGVRSRNDPQNPTPETPAIFVLRKMGDTEPLVQVPLRTIKVPKGGQPVEISLVTGTTTTNGRGELIIECWTFNAGLDPNLNEHYAWRSRVSIPGGGLVERKGGVEFEAPASGYVSSVEIDMPASAERWKRKFEKQFFAKLRDGTFARLSLELNTSGDHFIALESYLNPIPGHRNLEFDPAKTIPRTP